MPRNRTDILSTKPARKRRMRNCKKKREIMRIATWNIKTLNNKDQEVEKELRDKRIDICALQETKKKGKGQMWLGEYLLIYSGVERNERAKEGVALMIHKKLAHNIQICKYVSERIIVTKLKSDNGSINIVGIYSPENCKPEDVRNKFYEKLQETVDTIPKSEITILLGDFNARVGNSIIAGIKQKYNEHTTNENGELLIDFCTQNEFRINNTFFKHKEQHKYTFQNTRGGRSIIDYILTSRGMHYAQILDVRCLCSTNVGSDHNLVLGKIRMTIRNPCKITRTAHETKVRVEGLQDESTQNLYKTRLENEINDNSVTEEENVEDSWRKIKNNIIKAAREALGERKINRSSRKTKHTPWFCEEIRIKCQEKTKAYLKYRSNKTIDAYEEYKTIRNETNTLVRKKKAEHWEMFSKEIEHDFYGLQKEIWRMIRGQRREMKELIEVRHIEKETWVNHLKQLQKKTENTAPETPEIITNEIVQVDEPQVEEALKMLKNRKSAGKDGIQNELLKYGGAKLTKELTKLINKIMETSQIPEEWRTSIMIPLFKKGEKTDPNNYRGINLLSTTLKLTTRIISNKINSITQISEEQQGFRSGRSCNDAVFVIRQIIEKSIEYNRPAFLCFVDLEKAFDRVQLQDVIHILYNRNIPLNIIKLIENIYVRNKIEARINSELTEPIEMTTGIRQGDSLSPLLFNIILDEIIKQTKTKRGYGMGNERIQILCYADDTVLIAENEDDLQRLLHIFNTTAKKLNMKISTEKTKSVVIAKEPIRCKLEIDNQMVEQVSTTKYLGIKLSYDNNIEDEVRDQTIKANRTAGCLNDTIWRNKHLRIETKARIYKAVVRPVMTYTAETRPETRRTQRYLETSEMKTLRKIAGKTLWDRETNENIRRICGVENINTWVKSRKQEWNLHIDRMTEQRIVKIARDKSPTGRRGIGRPRKRWNDDL